MTDEAIGREIRQLREDIRDDLAQLSTAIGRLVSREVHDAELGRLTDRVATAERELARLEREQDAHLAAEEERRKSDRTERRSDRRLVVGAVLGVIGSYVLQILRGTGTLP